MMHDVFMASIVKRGDFYSASFIDIDGNRRQVATKEKNVHEAQAIADHLEIPHQLKTSGSEVPLLYAANLLNIRTHTMVCNISEEINQLKIDTGEKFTEISKQIEKLKDLTELSFEVARYPYANALKQASSFSGMPAEADLEIRASFKVSKRRGGGDMRLHLATRLLRELNFSSRSLSEDGHKRAWRNAWVALGEAILENHIQESIPIHSLIRSASTLLETRSIENLEQHPDTNESRVYWYIACCYKANKRLIPRSVIHNVMPGSGMTKPTINRILGSWEKICTRYDREFKFPLSTDKYNDLANYFTSEEDLKKGRQTYFKI